MKTVTIVGGGAVGVSALYQIVVSTETPLNIVIFNKGKELGLGMPYSTPCSEHILNLPADISSAIPSERKHFRQWLDAHPEQWRSAYSDYDPNTNQFPSRKLFGLYLMWIAKEAQRIARQKGVHIRIVNGEVFDLERVAPQKWFVHYRRGEANSRLSTNKVLLATGHMPSSPYPELENVAGYISDPWGILPENLVSLPEDAVIGLIGTRLTATDCLFRLRHEGYKGRVIMLSRSGRLPAIIGQTKPHKFLYLTPQNLSEIRNKINDGYIPLNTILDLFWQEVSEAVGYEVSIKTFSKVPDPKSWLHSEIERVSVGDETKWQSVLYSLYTMTPSIWHYLSDLDKTHFMEQYHSLFMTYLAAFPKASAEKLLRELESDSLQVVGGLSSINENIGEGFSVVSDAGETQCSYLINTTGPGYDIEYSHNPLLQAMLKRGICQKHPFGGIDVDFENFAVRGSDGVLQPDLCCVGELTRGVRWATTDLGQASRQVASCLPFMLVKEKPSYCRSACFAWCSLFKQTDKKSAMAVLQSKPVAEKSPALNSKQMCFFL